MGAERTQRIGIVGGGAAGLSAAFRLRQRGYRDVQVLEQGATAGGKCHTRLLDGRPYELGSVGLSLGYTEVLALLRELDLPAEPFPRWGRAGLYELNPPRFADPTFTEQVALLAPLANFYRKRGAAGDLRRPGFAGLDADLGRPLGQWLQDHGLGALATPLAALLTGYGYGYLDAVPAAYGLKFLEPLITLPVFAGRGIYAVRGGYQRLCSALAERVTVRCGARVTAIRRGATVTVELAGGDRLEFDRVIFTAAPDDLPALLDADDEERTLLQRVRHYVYHVALVRGAGWPASLTCVPRHFSAPAGDGRLVSTLAPWPDHPAGTAYAIASPGLPAETVRARLCEDLAALGVRQPEIVEHRAWKYFPHVAPGDFADGFHGKIEARQGRGGLYLAGELLNFSSVEHVCRYSRHLVETHF